MTVDARYCPRCGAPLPGRPPVTCTGCGYALFVNARPAVNIIIIDGDRFLAVKRAAPPRAGLWETPGGFCDGWEHPADAAVREAREELGVAVRLDGLVGIYIGEYDFQQERLPVLECFYVASIAAGTLRLDPGECSDHAWLPLADPPPLAFATMDRALADFAVGRSGSGAGTLPAVPPGADGRGTAGH